MNNTWVTNDFRMAKKLRRIDARLHKARDAAKDLCLSDKIIVLRDARRVHNEAMGAIAAELLQHLFSAHQH